MHPNPSSMPTPDGPQEPRSGPSAVSAKPIIIPKRRTGKWSFLIAAFILIAAAAAYYFKAQNDARVAAKSSLVSVSTAVVGLGDLHATVRVNGTVNAKNFAALMAPRILGSRSGLNRGGDGPGGGGSDFSLVLMKLAKPGVHVKTGEVIAEFDPQNQLQRLDDYKDSAVQQENTVKKMLANLAAVKEAHDQSVRAAKATWEKAVLDLKTADVRSAIDAEKFKLAVEEDNATYKQLLAEADLVDASQTAQIRVSQLNRDQSKIEVARAEANVKKMTVKAPMDGIVVMQSVVRNGEFGQIREGDQVAAGQPFVSIVDPTSMVLNATVNQVDAEKLRLGMKSVVRLDAYPDIELPGTLVGIGAMAKASTFRARFVGEIPITIKLEKTDPRVIPDLSGSAEIILNSERSTTTAPLSAVFTEAGGSYVFVQGPEGWIKKQVQLGLPSFTMVAIRSGLQKGDVIALQRPM